MDFPVIWTSLSYGLSLMVAGNVAIVGVSTAGYLAQVWTMSHGETPGADCF